MFIEYKNVNIYQGDKLVLGGVDFHVDEGEFVYIIGHVGSGKSSLLKTLYCELDIDEGDEAVILERNLLKMKRKEVPALRKELGIIFQDFQLLHDRSVYNNLRFVLKATGWKNKKDMDELVDFLDWRDLWESPTWVDYYGVTAIAADVDGITTTLNGGTLGQTLLSDVTDAVSFEYKPTGATSNYGGKDFGYLYYGNNGSVTATFQIRVPLTITYDWGKITTAYVDITVQPTQANRAARR